MPCYDERSTAGYAEAQLQPRIDMLARVACSLAKRLKKAGAYDSLPIETLDWVKAHVAFDESRP